jgi:murein DD-endopeptidase MepM/ murein hydrolase activator NlpD
MIMKLILLRVLLVVSLAVMFIGAGLPPQPVQAQSAGLIYVIQEGDSLYSISQYFHTSPARIELRNYLTDASIITPGMRIYIPGFDDLSGTLQQIKIGIGDSPLSLMRSSQSNASTFARINFLTSPDAMVIGQRLFTITKTASANVRVPIADGGLTGLEMAVENNLNPWTATEYNSLPGTWYLIPNDILYFPAGSGGNENDVLPGVSEITSTSLSQGSTAVLTLKGSGAPQVTGNLVFNVVDVDKEQANQVSATASTPATPTITTPTIQSAYTLNFFAKTDGSMEAVQGVPRMTIPGIAKLTLTAKNADGNSYTFDQNLIVKKVDYGYDSAMQVSSETVDPKVTGPEDQFLFTTVAPITATRYWNGAFTHPTATPNCKSDTYGKLRSFNGSDYIYWHSGTDYCGAVGDKVFAAADGVVVFAGELTVRGNATIIDHGDGVYTGYYHQSKLEVAVGDQVKAGQEIGLIGSTGRVTGPHLHFDVLVGDVQVNPDEWLGGQIP